MASNSLVWRFCAYGFLKNLEVSSRPVHRTLPAPCTAPPLLGYALTPPTPLSLVSQFFEPFLVVILLQAYGLTLLQVGMLQSVTMAVQFAGELPSGLIADRWGKKNGLLLCFAFYILSFGLYYLSDGALPLLLGAAVLEGLGEAFRSGSHKAMMMQWLDRQGLAGQKSWLYSRTRSFSLLGSSLSASAAVALALTASADRMLFLYSAAPYALDMAVVASYPAYFNHSHDKKKNKATTVAAVAPPPPQQPARCCASWAADVRALRVALRDGQTRRVLLSSAANDATFKTLKHYIQPLILLQGALIFSQLGVAPPPVAAAAAAATAGADGSREAEEALRRRQKVALGVIYTLFYACSALATRHAWRIAERFASPKRGMDALLDTMAALLFSVGALLRLGAPLGAVLVYLLVYVNYNVRRPIALHCMAELWDKEKRATLLSVEALLKALLVMTLAPLFGALAHYASLETLFLVAPALLLAANWCALRGEAALPGEAHTELREDGKAAATPTRTTTGSKAVGGSAPGLELSVRSKAADVVAV
jgi:MFS family permease